MSLFTYLKDKITAPIKAYQEFEAGLSLTELKQVISVGGTGMAVPHGNWVIGNTPGHLYSNWTQAYFQGTHLNYADRVGPLWHNTAYRACLGAYQDAFSQAPICIKKMQSDGQKVVLPDHELMELLEWVNEEDDGVTLLDGTLIDYFGPGNAYWLIVADSTSTGNPKQLNLLPNQCIKPITPQDLGQPYVLGMPQILYYEYATPSGPIKIPKEEIVHIRLGKNPHAPHMGLGYGDTLLQEIFADNEGTTYQGLVLWNMGIPARILMPKIFRNESGFDDIVKFDAQQVTRIITQATSGDNRFKTVGVDVPLDIHESDTSPEKMALDKIRRYPESRITAVTRVPAQVAGLIVGEDVKTYANYEEARKAYWQDSVLPSMRRIRSQVTRQLIWRNQKYKARNIWFGFNYDEVPALQIDEQARDTNIRENFKYGLIDAAEGRSQMGLEPKPGDEGRMFTATPAIDPEEALIQDMQAGRKEYVSPLTRIAAEIEALDALNGHHNEDA